ncbi:hypothetical protein IRJ41_016916, partial [Triplophysa rosa]
VFSSSIRRKGIKEVEKKNKKLLLVSRSAYACDISPPVNHVMLLGDYEPFSTFLAMAQHIWP